MDTGHRYTIDVLFLCDADIEIEFIKELPLWAIPAPGDEILSRELMDAFGTTYKSFNVVAREWSWDSDRVVIEVSPYDPLA